MIERTVAAAVAIAGAMLVEAWWSGRNEQRLRAAGAVEPEDDVYRAMAVVYPAAFGAMVVESVLGSGPGMVVFTAGAVVWLAAKALKTWAIVSLGPRWSFRVLVPPDAPLVSSGPYRWMRHPNYVAVAGELAGAGIMMAAPWTGVAGTVIFVELMRRRVRVEERALGIARS